MQVTVVKFPVLPVFSLMKNDPPHAFCESYINALYTINLNYKYTLSPKLWHPSPLELDLSPVSPIPTSRELVAVLFI